MLELRRKHNLAYLLRVANLARSTFYYQKNKMLATDKYADLKKRIRHIFETNKGRYGYRRILSVLKSEGIHVNHKTVRRLMNDLALQCRVRIKKYRSYKGEVGLIAPNILERQFKTTRPNQKWVTDVTEFKINDKKLYLSPIMDLYNGEIVSFVTAKRPLFNMVDTMLDKAFDKIKGTTGLILHSDQGWQYQHIRYRSKLKNNFVVQSMSRRGNCLDNAPIESFFGTLKSELYNIDSFTSVDHLQQEIEKYIDYYNNKRIKLKLNGLSPVQYRLLMAN